MATALCDSILRGDFSALAFVVVTLASAYIASRAVHSCWFHPLSRYPGPRLSACTELVFLWYWVKGDLVTYIDNVHREYGKTVRVAPNGISYLDSNVWKDLYGHKNAASKRPSVVKDPQLYGPASNGRYSMLAAFDDTEHARLRKIFSHGFSDRALKAQEYILRMHVDKMVRNVNQLIADDAAAPVDLVRVFNCTTFDIIGELAFGESLGLLDGDQGRYRYIESLSLKFKLAPLLKIADRIPLLGQTLKLLLASKIKNSYTARGKFSSDLVETRLEKGQVTEKPDFWTLVLKASESNVLDVEDMKANADLFMAAGSETTATMLSGLMNNLLLNPEKMKKLVEEVRGAFSSGEDITIDNAQRLKYLAACFNESMRLYPSTPLGPPRVILPGGGEINGHHVPENTKVAISIYSSFRSPLHFKDALDFVPERWVTSDPLNEKYIDDNREVFQPFSLGPRNCIGQNLALHEMRLIAVRLLRNFDFELCKQSRGWFNQKVFWALWDKPPLWVKVTPVRVA